MEAKAYDVFISHASEDKGSVARPLAAALLKAGARIWLDEFELRLGDSLSGKIDQGLASSRFGVVILSPSFFAKRWPKTELAGLRALEEDGRKVILPVWHDVDKATVARNSPVLADLLAIPTSEGIDKVAKAILDVIFRPGSGSPSATNPSVSRRLLELINGDPPKKVFMDFIRSYPKLIAHLMRSGVNPLWDIDICGVNFDAVAVANVGTTRVPTLNLILFLPIWGTPFIETDAKESEAAVKPQPLLKLTIDAVNRVIAEYQKHTPDSDFAGAIHRIYELFKEDERYMQWWIGDLPPLIEATVFCGRREFVDATKATAAAWRSYRSTSGSIRLRTYDGLVEALQQAERGGSWDFRS